MEKKMTFSQKQVTGVFTYLKSNKFFQLWYGEKEYRGFHQLFRDGKLNKECYYAEDGRLDGDFKIWDHNRKLLTHLLYKDGEIVKDYLSDI